jgi:hypothetical protein
MGFLAMISTRELKHFKMFGKKFNLKAFMISFRFICDSKLSLTCISRCFFLPPYSLTISTSFSILRFSSSICILYIESTCHIDDVKVENCISKKDLKSIVRKHRKQNRGEIFIHESVWACVWVGDGGENFICLKAGKISPNKSNDVDGLTCVLCMIHKRYIWLSHGMWTLRRYEYFFGGSMREKKSLQSMVRNWS